MFKPTPVWGLPKIEVSLARRGLVIEVYMHGQRRVQGRGFPEIEDLFLN